MRIKSSRTFSFDAAPTKTSRLLGRTISQHASLGDASAAWADGHQPKHQTSSAAEGDVVREQVRDDLGYQAFLNSAITPGGTAAMGDGLLSCGTLSVAAADTINSATRGSVSVGGEAGPVTASALTIPTAAGVKVGGAVSDTADVAGLLLAGKRGKTAGLELTNGAITAGTSLTLVADSKITILGDVQVGSDGVARRLARFSSLAMPVVDVGLSGASEHVGGALRLVLAYGKAAVYEKQVPIDQLSAMMRQRSGILRNGIEALTACGVMAGMAVPSARSLAADMGQVSAMRDGESVMWKSTLAMVLGVAGGSFGARATATAQYRGEATYRLERLAGDIARLTFQPTTVKGLRLGVELRLAADLAGEYLTSANQQRSFDFNLNMMSSIHALSRALRGHMPGIVFPQPPSGPREAYALLSTMSAEKLPFGVTYSGSDFAQASQVSLGLSSVRLPELLGGASLGVSEGFIKSFAGTVDADGANAAVARSSSRVSSQDILFGGSLSQATSAILVSSVSIGPKGEQVVKPQGIETAISRETQKSSSFARRRIAASVDKLVADDLLVRDVKPTDSYAVKITQTIGIADLNSIGQLSDPQLVVIARATTVPLSIITKLRDQIRLAASSADEKGYADALSTISRHGTVGVKALHMMAGDKVPVFSVANASHDKLLTDFFKAETYALGAKTCAHARHAIKRLGKLDQAISLAKRELEGDGVLRLVADDEHTKRQIFLSVMQVEARLLANDIAESLPG